MDEPSVEPAEATVVPWPSRLHEFFGSRRGRAAFFLIAFLLVLGAAGIAAYVRYFAGEQTDGEPRSFLPSFTLTDSKPTKPALLTGVSVDPTLATRRPLAIMVENHPDARPQAGLGKAAVVFEAIVEGGITRFLAIFGPEEASPIGPIRSARPAYIAWAASFHSLYVHAGGSQAALALIPQTSAIVGLPHTAAYFQREPRPGIASEHTLFSSTKQLYAFAKEKEAGLEASFEAWKFSDGAPADERPAAASLGIDYGGSYGVSWTYDPTGNVYQRSVAGSTHVDRESGDQLVASNVVVIEVERRHAAGENQGKGEWYMTTEGSGPAKVFRNGSITEGEWRKPGRDEMLRLYDAGGQELSLVRGTTWVEVVPPGLAVTHEEKAAETATQ